WSTPAANSSRLTASPAWPAPITTVARLTVANVTDPRNNADRPGPADRPADLTTSDRTHHSHPHTRVHPGMSDGSTHGHPPRSVTRGRRHERTRLALLAGAVWLRVDLAERAGAGRALGGGLSAARISRPAARASRARAPPR